MIKCYHCSGKHELVAQVKACSTAKPSTPMADWKTAQAAAIAKYPTLAAKVEIGTIVEDAKKVTVPAHRTTAAYKALKAQVAPTTPVQTIDQQVAEHDAALAVIKKGQDLECGMYQITGANGEVVIYKIKWNKTNTYKYAERLWITTSAKWDIDSNSWIDMPKGKFIYANSMMKTLTSEHKMTEEMAKAFHDATKAKYGVDYGFCCVCGKLLTVKKSIADGYGPVCAKYFS